MYHFRDLVRNVRVASSCYLCPEQSFCNNLAAIWRGPIWQTNEASQEQLCECVEKWILQAPSILQMTAVPVFTLAAILWLGWPTCPSFPRMLLDFSTKSLASQASSLHDQLVSVFQRPFKFQNSKSHMLGTPLVPWKPGLFHLLMKILELN